MGPTNQQAKSLPVNVDLSTQPDLKCECGNIDFIPGMRFKVVSGILVGEREDQLVPIQTMVCSKCGKSHPKFLPQGS